MAYIDAIYDRDNDKIQIAERIDGKRILKDFPAIYEFYYDDPNGKYKSTHRTPVSHVKCKSSSDFYKELKIHNNKKIYESDFNPVFRFLSENYKDVDSPTLHTAFFDIETDFCQERGYAPTSDPFNQITAISLYLNWLDKLICLVIAPSTLTPTEANDIVNGFEKDDVILFNTEVEMVEAFFLLIDDADVLSGWNSEAYDIPYQVNRVTKIMNKNATRKFCLWNKLPKKRTFERYGKEQQTYDLVGRIHMDYMQLYQKYTYHEMHSYALDAIAEYELGEHKVPYKGTLDQLYNQDFKKFIEYSLQDTMLLAKLDRKLKFLDLANELAHANTVLIPTTAGSVALIEQAIINEAHERGFVVPNKTKEEIMNTKAAGAYVAYPKKGIHKWIGSIDINSLYPSIIRSLNMAPETIIGQLRPTKTDKYIKDKMTKRKGETQVTFAGAWEGLFSSLEYSEVMDKRSDIEIDVDWDDGKTSKHMASELYDIVFNPASNWALSANGTIFSYENEGIIPGLLERWYAERKVMQKKKRESTTKEDIAFWDKRQLVKKILLNSLYGAILNKHCRFFDKRIGQSTTLTGRAIAQHMDAYVNQCLTGKYKHDGECIVYGDSVTGDSMIRVFEEEDSTIADLYNSISHKVETEHGKEYAIVTDEDTKVLGYNSVDDVAEYNEISYVMRHKTDKQMYKITVEDGKSVTVTEDHSIIIDRDGSIHEITPVELLEDDLIISV